jgi:GTP-binding protein
MNEAYFSAAFVQSADALPRCPESIKEVAFAGRSNAGKSSAINTITRQKKLARTSKTPGRTQLLNYFAVGNDKRFIVDLPGYGFAEVSKAKKQAWQAAMQQYLTRREPLVGVVLVMDIRHPLTDSDWQMIDIQQQGDAELHVLLTKGDKLARGPRIQTVRKVQNTLAEAGVEATIQDFSSLKAEGVSDAHAILDAWLFGSRLDL